MNAWKLRASMLATLALIIGTSTAFFGVLLGYFGFLNVPLLMSLVASFHFIQWLFAPYLINALYQVKVVTPSESPRLHAMVDRLSRKSGIPTPQLGLANISIPNAFAYGSPIAGSRVTVTMGLLDTLEEEEVEAVLGHELGHLKHRDVQIMMLASFLPSLVYIVGRSMLYSTYGASRRDRGSATAVLIGMASIGVYWLLLLGTLSLSRLREYYADRHSISVVEDGARKLSEGLSKIVLATGRKRVFGRRDTFTVNSFKSLFVSDPDRALRDAVEIAKYSRSDHALVEHLLMNRMTFADRILELLSTHPNITKRLLALQAT